MVCRIKNRHTFKSLPILNSAYFTECRFVIRHITQTDTETETEANFTHPSNKQMPLKIEKICTTKAYIGKISISLINLYLLQFFHTKFNILNRNLPNE